MQIGDFVGERGPRMRRPSTRLRPSPPPCRSSGRRWTIGTAGSCGPRTTAPNVKSTTGWALLFDFLGRSGLDESTLVVVTSDHGEMGGDHWLTEKLGYWDESFHVPLIVVDPRPEAEAGRGTVVDAVTESVDILPTICEYIGAEVPLQADGWSLAPFTPGPGRPRALAGHGPLRMGLLRPFEPHGRETSSTSR